MKNCHCRVSELASHLAGEESLSKVVPLFPCDYVMFISKGNVAPNLNQAPRYEMRYLSGKHRFVQRQCLIAKVHRTSGQVALLWSSLHRCSQPHHFLRAILVSLPLAHCRVFVAHVWQHPLSHHLIGRPAKCQSIQWTRFTSFPNILNIWKCPRLLIVKAVDPFWILQQGRLKPHPLK